MPSMCCKQDTVSLPESFQQDPQKFSTVPQAYVMSWGYEHLTSQSESEDVLYGEAPRAWMTMGLGAIRTIASLPNLGFMKLSMGMGS